MKPQRQGLESFVDVVSRISEEREEAQAEVDKLIRSGTASVWDSEIPATWRTAGFVEALTTAAFWMHETDPGESLSLAQLALSIATVIPRDSYPSPVKARLEGNAWKEIGRAHTYRSAYAESIRAYGSAIRSFAQEGALVHDEITVMFARAAALSVANRPGESTSILDEVVTILREFGDERRILMTELLRGVNYHIRGELHDARSVYEHLLEKMVSSNDLHTLAALRLNLGQVGNAIGNFDEAIDHLREARRLFVELRQPSEIDRADWFLANVAINQGNLIDAVATLRLVRDAYLARQMPREAGHVALDIVDALVALGQLEEARLLTARVVEEFAAAKLSVEALTGLSYLRDLLPTASEPRKVVDYVRSYLQRQQREPSLLFLPLPEPKKAG